ncbi:MAG: GNAT family N-acetyltransferase [Lachnospiraceae bacterium]|jgi:ribosomal-protein-alanine N-acetyltransferase|nr:GNAT family N-acetyltransferase [Lachnospiraceae bacterium]
MIVKIILEEELSAKELKKLEILFRETDRDILRDFLILTDSPELARICRKLDMAVAAVLTEEGKDFPGISYAVTDTENLDETYLERIWRRYRGIPWRICETKRCFVRESVPEDVESFYRIYRDKDITEYMEDLFEDPEKERQYIRDYMEKVYGFYGFGMWTVCLRESGEVIGRAGLSMREGFDEPELGYVIGKKWQGRGIAEEVCREILSYGREELGIERVRVLMHPDNAASERLCHKLGFTRTGEEKLEGVVYSTYMTYLG